ncbi:MAG TPA: hypothetical protein VEL74_19380 [Thermoanaerobaculia bacterium]|nr:hypothetical protein [Thermoanaerobaculia bacterium]
MTGHRQHRRHPGGRALTAALLGLLLLPGALAPAPAPPDLEPPRALTPRGLANLMAFSRLLGYVRYFHPSDQAAAVDWNTLAIAGVQAAEPAADAVALARTLEDFFHPIAPALRVFAGGRRPELPAEILPPADTDPTKTAWHHLGGGTGGPFHSHRFQRSIGEPGRLRQSLVAAPLLGKKVRFKAAVRAEVEPPHEARLSLLVDLPGAEEPREVTIPSGGWQTLEIVADIPAEARDVEAGVLLLHQGRVWIDGAVLEVVGEEGGNLLRNPGFERGNTGTLPFGWSVPRGADEAGYVAEIREERPAEGRRCAALSWVEPEPVFPKPHEPFLANLGGGVAALVPMALYVDGQGTRPPVPPEVTPPAPAKPARFEPSGQDRATRLAAVALAWSALEHFYPFFEETGTDWNGALRRALTSAATDPGDAAFIRTLQRLVAALQDGQARVAGPAIPQRFLLPILWDWIEGRLVVTAVLPKKAGEIVPGDVILSLDGRPAEEALAAAEELTAAATSGARRFAAVRTLLAGNPFEAVQVEVQPFRGEPFSTTLIRSISPEGDKDLQEPRPEPVAGLDRGVLYLDLIRMDPADVRRAMALIPEATGIVFDARAPMPGPGMDNNIRRFLPLLTVDSLEMPRRSVAVITRPDRRAWQDYPVSHLSPQMPRFEGEVAFLMNSGVIGELESFLTLVEHYRIGALVGSPTAATIGEVSSIRLPGGYAVYWTGTRIRKQDGSRHHAVGIQPQLDVVRSRGLIAAGRDEVLEKAWALVAPPVERQEE